MFLFFLVSWYQKKSSMFAKPILGRCSRFSYKIQPGRLRLSAYPHFAYWTRLHNDFRLRNGTL